MSTASTRRPALAAIAATIALVATLTFASAGRAATVTGSSKGLTASLHVGTHHPTVGRKWPLQMTATRAGRPAKVTVTYEYLYAGHVVAVRAHHTFVGKFSDALIYPASAVGEPLTFRAAITAGSITIDLDYAIEVVR